MSLKIILSISSYSLVLSTHHAMTTPPLSGVTKSVSSVSSLPLANDMFVWHEIHVQASVDVSTNYLSPQILALEPLACKYNLRIRNLCVCNDWGLPKSRNPR